MPPPEDCVFGEMTSLPGNMLPLNCDVGKALALKKFQNKDKNKGLSEVYLFEELAEEIQYNTGGCPFRVPSSIRPSQILHLTCSVYISLNNGRILMFKVSK